ncbi:MAG: hypothetical protein IJ772_04870 [Bacilli bacterium]|nr:hypothetical protein [Bacilli bacterium]
MLERDSFSFSEDRCLLIPTKDEEYLFPEDLRDNEIGVESSLRKFLEKDKNYTFEYLFFNRKEMNVYFLLKLLESHYVTKKIEESEINLEICKIMRVLCVDVEKYTEKENEFTKNFKNKLAEIYSSMNEIMYMNNKNELNKKIQKIETENKKFKKLKPMFLLTIESKGINEEKSELICDEINIVSIKFNAWCESLKNMRRNKGDKNGSINRFN